MRLVSYEAGDRPARGHARAATACTPSREAPHGRRRCSPGRARGPAEGDALDEVALLPPVGRPGKIICIGLNYRAHAEEQGLEPPETPTFFAKFANALAAPGATVALPALSRRVDYEAEVAFVIGARGKDVPEERALEHVAGYTLLNDLSARDLQFKTPQWMPGKTFDGAGPAGRRWSRPTRPGPMTPSRSSCG